MLVLYFLIEKNYLYIEFFLLFKSFSRMLGFFFAFFFVFFIFILIIESIESFDSNYNIKRFDKVFESSFNDNISSVFESSLSSNQSDKIYLSQRNLFKYKNQYRHFFDVDVNR